MMDELGNRNILRKSEMCFHFSGTSYSFVSQTSTCRHEKDWYNAPYYCTGGSGGKFCEKQCSNWTACIGFSVLMDTGKCIMYPSLATPCPKGWSRGGNGPVATTVLDLVDGGSPGYCKLKQGQNNKTFLRIIIYMCKKVSRLQPSLSWFFSFIFLQGAGLRSQNQEDFVLILGKRLLTT